MELSSDSCTNLSRRRSQNDEAADLPDKGVNIHPYLRDFPASQSSTRFICNFSPNTKKKTTEQRIYHVKDNMLHPEAAAEESLRSERRSKSL